MRSVLSSPAWSRSRRRTRPVENPIHECGASCPADRAPRPSCRAGWRRAAAHSPWVRRESGRRVLGIGFSFQMPTCRRPPRRCTSRPCGPGHCQFGQAVSRIPSRAPAARRPSDPRPGSFGIPIIPADVGIAGVVFFLDRGPLRPREVHLPRSPVCDRPTNRPAIPTPNEQLYACSASCPSVHC